jgi:hypothetical protein
LRERLVVEALRLQAAVAALDAEQTVAFAGRALHADDLSMHGRSEAALHRWDLVGDDDAGAALQAQPELTAHAVVVLNEMLDGSGESVASRARNASFTPGEELVFASPGAPDVVLVHDHDGGRLALRSAAGHADATADPATRLLALWGRRSNAAIRWTDDLARREQFAAFLGVDRTRR